MEEVKLRGDTSYRYEGIPTTDMKDQLECPYCGEIYPDLTHLKPHIEKKHKDLLERMNKDEAVALRFKKIIRKSIKERKSRAGLRDMMDEAIKRLAENGGGEHERKEI